MKKRKPKKIKKINEKTGIVTLDIGKNIHYGYLRAPNGDEIAPFPLYNTPESYHGFWETICQFKQRQMLDKVIVGFESTGPYAEPISHFLRKKPVKLVQVNPVHTKRIKELTGNSPNKTDKKDPRVIADVISLGHALTLVIPEGPAAELRRLTQARERAIKSRTAMINTLQHLVYVIFPEFLSILKISTKSAKYLIKHYTTPRAMFDLGFNRFFEILKKVSRGRIDSDRAKRLFKAAEHSIGLSEGQDSISIEVAHLIAKIETEDQFIDSMEKQMHTYLQKIPYSQNLLSIKGLGEVTVAGLIGEVGDFGKFDTISEVLKLAGLDLYEISSGQRKGQHRISKRGRPLMRKQLFFIAINMVKSNGIMHARYQKMLSRGMIKMKALVAISRKILGLIFAIARDNTMYVENYDRRNHYKLAA